MAHPAVTTDDLTRLLDDLVGRVAEGAQAVALSPDGLLLAASAGVDRELAERVSCVLAGIRALAVAAGRHADTGMVRQIIIEMGEAFLSVSATPGGAIFAVRFPTDSDVGATAYEVALVAELADRHLPAFPEPAMTI